MTDNQAQDTSSNHLVEQGRLKIRWAELHQGLLQRLRKQFSETKPFAGLTIGMCLHVEPKTAVLCTVLQAGGATVVITGSPGTTKDDVAAALRQDGVVVYGQQEDDSVRHQENIRRVLSHDPHLLLDNGADLMAAYLAHPGQGRVIASTEETTTGANRLRDELRDALIVPTIVINDSPLKLIMENEHGVGPTIVEGFMRETNLLVQSRRFVVFGYGSVGRGIARTLRKLGVHVTVVEPDPIRALEAVLDGMVVTSLDEALKIGEVFFTATGRPGVIAGESIDHLPDGAILANAGHFSWEIDIAELRRRATSIEHFRAWVELITLEDGRRITLLAQGEMLNLAGGGGNPIETMDLGLALQAQSLAYLAVHYKKLPVGPQPVPGEINATIARWMVENLSRRSSVSFTV
ncbi:MAG TPA: adenosylhomocysteinase [Ktedonobacteraceae bacterium]|nr:adenosylhomocysteinase [Ktedonobacteraceae bacterium]